MPKTLGASWIYSWTNTPDSSYREAVPMIYDENSIDNVIVGLNIIR